MFLFSVRSALFVYQAPSHVRENKSDAIEFWKVSIMFCNIKSVYKQKYFYKENSQQKIAFCDESITCYQTVKDSYFFTIKIFCSKIKNLINYHSN